MKRYRYILSGIVDPDHPVCHYRLIAGNQLIGQSDAVRIEIPDDMDVKYGPCDGYSTTDDRRLLKDLRPVPMVKINSRWARRPGLDPRHLLGLSIQTLGGKIMTEIRNNWHETLNGLLRAERKDTVDITMHDGKVLTLTFCAGYGDVDMSDPDLDIDQFEYVLVSGGGVSHYMGGEPSKICDQLDDYDVLKMQYDEDVAKLKAYCEANKARNDPDEFGFFSDWHKDVYGYRPHDWSCDRLNQEAKFI